MKENCRKGKYWIFDEFKKEAVLKHGNKFDYSKVELCGANAKIIIVCPEHGEFKQTANGHLRYGCYECSPRKKKTTEDFIREAKQVHGDKFDYSLVEYVGTESNPHWVSKQVWEIVTSVSEKYNPNAKKTED